MKKNYITLFFMICSAALYAQIPNPSFEIWNTTLYSDPTGWMSGNNDAVRKLGIIPITQVSGQTGSAVRLETMIVGPDTAGAYVTNGDPFNGQGGVPCGPSPTAVTGFYRYGVQPGDSAIILAVFKSGGLITSSQFFYFTGTQNTFTSFSFPLSPTGMVDTVIFAAASSNLLSGFGIKDGSFLELDGIALAGTMVAIPNNGFENWSTMNYYQLIGWEGYGDFSKTGDYHTGAFAIKLTTQLDNGGGVNSAGITSGHNGNFGPPSGGAPYTLTADTLTGYYKYFGTNDSASIYVTLNKNGAGIGGNYKALHPISIYTYFEMGFYAGQTPDSIRIDVNSSAYPASFSSVGNTLYLDDLRLKSQPAANIFNVQGNILDQAFVFPNPLGNEGAIQLQKPLSGLIRLCVYDVTGRSVMEEYFNNSGRHLPLNVANLNAGMYYLEISCGDIRMQNSFVKK